MSPCLRVSVVILFPLKAVRAACVNRVLRAVLFLSASLFSSHAQGFALSPSSSESSPNITLRIGIDPKMGASVPLDVPFFDEDGAEVRLVDYLHDRPALLVPVYYECPMLCSQVLGGLVTALKAVKLEPGRDFDLFAVSFDPEDTKERAAAKKRMYLERYAHPGAASAFHFWRGEKASIVALTTAIGFRYEYDEVTRQYAHPSAVVTLTKAGKISRYFYGVEFLPRELRLGLVEASEGRVGSPVDRVLLLCYRYDPKSGRYSATTLSAIRGFGATLVLALLGFIATMLYRERKRQLRERRERRERFSRRPRPLVKGGSP